MDIRKLAEYIVEKFSPISFEEITDALVDWYNVYYDRTKDSLDIYPAFVEIDGHPFVISRNSYYSKTPLFDPMDCFSAFSICDNRSPWRPGIKYAISVRRHRNKVRIMMHSRYFSRVTEINPRLKDGTHEFVSCLEDLRSKLDKLEYELEKADREHRYTRYGSWARKVAIDEEWERTWNVDKTNETETEAKKETSND